jgi:hypothetical protein
MAGGPDGVLVMLIEPGTRDRCALAGWNWSPHVPRRCRWPDGGITEDIAPLCVTAGAQSIVVGRARYWICHHRPIRHRARAVRKETLT